MAAQQLFGIGTALKHARLGAFDNQQLLAYSITTTHRRHHTTCICTFSNNTALQSNAAEQAIHNLTVSCEVVTTLPRVKL